MQVAIRKVIQLLVICALIIIAVKLLSIKPVVHEPTKRRNLFVKKQFILRPGQQPVRVNNSVNDGQLTRPVNKTLPVIPSLSATKGESNNTGIHGPIKSTAPPKVVAKSRPAKEQTKQSSQESARKQDKAKALSETNEKTIPTNKPETKTIQTAPAQNSTAKNDSSVKANETNPVVNKSTAKNDTLQASKTNRTSPVENGENSAAMSNTSTSSGYNKTDLYNMQNKINRQRMIIHSDDFNYEIMAAEKNQIKI